MRPLDGVTVLDLSRVLAGPFASMVLAELGATVIKIENPDGGDETRAFEPQIVTERGSESAYYFACNRTKQSVAVNLRTAEGRDVIRRLAARADVMLENFPVGTMGRWGLDYPSLAESCPRLVYVSCTGFGQTGPYAHRKGYDTVFQAMGGLMSLTGEKGGGPVKPGLPVADLTSALWLAIATLAALVGRQASGRGSYVDFSMLDGQVALLTLAAARFFALGEVPARLGTEHPGRVPSASFRCRDGRWMHVTCGDQHWKRLCDALGLAALGEDPGLAENAGRVTRRDEVMEGLTRAIAHLDRDELGRLLDAADVPAGPLNAVDEVLADPHVVARGSVSHFDHPTAGPFQALALPFRFDGWDAPRLERPPLLGEHTDAVLRERLGLGDEEIGALRALRAIG